MTDLTEQWKKGKLPFGYYYVKFLNGKEGVKKLGEYAYRKLIKEVIDIVPNYEKWEQTQNWADFTSDYHKLREKLEITECENAQLKELLKECELWFTGVVGNMNDKNVGEHNRNLPIGNFENMFKKFSQKINQALGEDK